MQETQQEAKFHKWMQAIDRELLSLVGLYSADLADCCFADWFEEGLTPADAAELCLEENGFEHFI